MNDIILEYEKLIRSIVNKFNYFDKEDLFQVGCIGLMKAYENFNKDMGCKFSTYAYSYILGEIKKYMREDNTLKVSRDISRLSFKLEKIKDILAQQLMREPTVEELAMYLEIPVGEIIEAMNLTKNHVSLDEPIQTSDGDVSLYESISVTKDENLDSLLDLKMALNSLEKREKEIITRRYLEDQTQTKVAQEYNISQVKVYREEQKILAKLKQNLYQS